MSLNQEAAVQQLAKTTYLQRSMLVAFLKDCNI
jgi:hypothetical protein